MTTLNLRELRERQDRRIVLSTTTPVYFSLIIFFFRRLGRGHDSPSISPLSVGLIHQVIGIK